MGNELAAAAIRRGATVTLVTAAAPPSRQPGLDIVAVETADDMHAAVRAALPGARVLVMAAAVADWRTTRCRGAEAQEGIEHADARAGADRRHPRLAPRRRGGCRRLSCRIRGRDRARHRATRRRSSSAKQLDLIVVNDVSQSGIGMGADDNEVTVIDRDGGWQTHRARAEIRDRRRAFSTSSRAGCDDLRVRRP